MGSANAKYDSNTVYPSDDTSFAMINDHARGKVRFYSKDNFRGNIYEIERGNYPSKDFVPRISPDNVFSLTIPPQTYIKIYCGDIYDYGGKGFMHIENVTDQVMHVPSLPEGIEGQVKSVSIGVHSDIQTWSGSNISNRYEKPSSSTVSQSPIVDDQVSIYTSTDLEHFMRQLPLSHLSHQRPHQHHHMNISFTMTDLILLIIMIILIMVAIEIKN